MEEGGGGYMFVWREQSCRCRRMDAMMEGGREGGWRATTLRVMFR
jgi:hypothetical protein